MHTAHGMVEYINNTAVAASANKTDKESSNNWDSVDEHQEYKLAGTKLEQLVKGQYVNPSSPFLTGRVDKDFESKRKDWCKSCSSIEKKE